MNTWLDWWLSCHVGTSLGKSSWCLEKEYAEDKGCLRSTLWRKSAFEGKTTQDIFYSNFLFRVFCFSERLCKKRVGSDIEGLFMFGCCSGRSSQIVLWFEYTMLWSWVMLWFDYHNIEFTLCWSWVMPWFDHHNIEHTLPWMAMFYKANTAICVQVCYNNFEMEWWWWCKVCRNWNATTISRWRDDDDAKYAETQCSAVLIPFQGPIKLQSEHST